MPGYLLEHLLENNQGKWIFFLNDNDIKIGLKDVAAGVVLHHNWLIFGIIYNKIVGCRAIVVMERLKRALGCFR